MIHKAKGDGLHTYDIFQKVYTYNIFMCNYTSPKIYLSKRMLPLHARVMDFFDIMEVKYHQCEMDNMYNSGTFFKAA